MTRQTLAAAAVATVVAVLLCVYIIEPTARAAGTELPPRGTTVTVQPCVPSSDNPECKPTTTTTSTPPPTWPPRPDPKPCTPATCEPGCLDPLDDLPCQTPDPNPPAPACDQHAGYGDCPATPVPAAPRFTG